MKIRPEVFSTILLKATKNTQQTNNSDQKHDLVGGDDTFVKFHSRAQTTNGRRKCTSVRKKAAKAQQSLLTAVDVCLLDRLLNRNDVGALLIHRLQLRAVQYSTTVKLV